MPDLVRKATSLLPALLLILLATESIGVLLDFATAIRLPVELDYGEGIVWQQAALIPGPRAYATTESLPFIVFHYPPLYHLLVRAVTALQPDMLAAGRLVTAAATLLLAASAGALAYTATASPHPTTRSLGPLWTAGFVALFTLTLHAVRGWGMLMRVDTLGVALGILGLVVGARANGRLVGTTAALLLCVAAVYTKQTLLAAGIAVGIIALLRNPRMGLLAAAIAATAGGLVLIALQHLTQGGFLRNTVGHNVNRFELENAFWAIWPERSSLPFLLPMAVAAIAVATRLRHAGPVAAWTPAITARAMALVHLLVATLFLGTIFKSGGNYNYLLDVLVISAVLLGAWMHDVLPAAPALPRTTLLAGLAVACALRPYSQINPGLVAARMAHRDATLQRIAAATRPVSSENMTLLMQAGKPVWFEPAIVTELAHIGRWDEAPLITMIRAKGFEFMITTQDDLGGTRRRSPAVDAAMREAYPDTIEAGPQVFIHLPAAPQPGNTASPRP